MTKLFIGDFENTPSIDLLILNRLYSEQDQDLNISDQDQEDKYFTKSPCFSTKLE